MGRYNAELFSSHTCIIDSLMVFRDLKSLDVQFASHEVSIKEELELQEKFRVKLINVGIPDGKLAKGRKGNPKKPARGVKAKLRGSPSTGKTKGAANGSKVSKNSTYVLL